MQVRYVKTQHYIMCATFEVLIIMYDVWYMISGVSPSALLYWSLCWTCAGPQRKRGCLWGAHSQWGWLLLPLCRWYGHGWWSKADKKQTMWHISQGMKCTHNLSLAKTHCKQVISRFPVAGTPLFIIYRKLTLISVSVIYMKYTMKTIKHAPTPNS